MNHDDWFIEQLGADFLRKPHRRILPKRIFNHYWGYLTGQKVLPQDIGQRILGLYPDSGYRLTD